MIDLLGPGGRSGHDTVLTPIGRPKEDGRRLADHHRLRFPGGKRSDDEMELEPAGDSEVMSTSQISADQNCRFWDSISPGVARDEHSR